MQLTNNLSQAVNVYVTSSGGNELFLRQVPANTVEKVPVSGVASGSTVTFKAVTVDGSRTYQSRSAPLSALLPVERALSVAALRVAASRPARWLLVPVTADSFPGRRTPSGPFVFSPDVTAARPSGRGTSVRLGAA